MGKKTFGFLNQMLDNKEKRAMKKVKRILSGLQFALVMPLLLLQYHGEPAMGKGGDALLLPDGVITSSTIRSSYDWSGSYEASHLEGYTCGGLSIWYCVAFNLKKEGNTYVGTVDVDGPQIIRYTGTVTCRILSGNRIRVYSGKFVEGYASILPESVPLVEIRHEGGRLIPKWYAPMLEFLDKKSPIIKQ